MAAAKFEEALRDTRKEYLEKEALLGDVLSALEERDRKEVCVL